MIIVLFIQLTIVKYSLDAIRTKRRFAHVSSCLDFKAKERPNFRPRNFCDFCRNQLHTKSCTMLSSRSPRPHASYIKSNI